MAVKHWAQAWHALSVHKMLMIRLSKNEWTGRFGPPNLSPTPEKSILGTNVAFFTEGSLTLSVPFPHPRTWSYKGLGRQSIWPTPAPHHCDPPMGVTHALPGGLPKSGAAWNTLGFGFFWLISPPLWVSDVPFITESFTHNRYNH